MQTCAHGAYCDPDGSFCRCPAGQFACPSGGCADFASDPDNCGQCGARCDSGSACVNGVCEHAEHAIAPLLVSANANLVGGNAAAGNCINETEAVASPVPVNGTTVMFAASGSNQNSAALGSWNNWNVNSAATPPAAFNIPQDAGLSAVTADNWTTYSTQNNLVYAVAPARRTSSTACQAFASTSPATAGTGAWSSPYACESSADEFLDQPATVFDNGSRDLYSGAWSGSQIVLHFYRNCTGQPGTASCPRTAAVSLPVGVDSLGLAPGLRFGLAVNPGSGHLVLVYWFNSTLVIRFFTHDGIATGATATIDSGLLWGTNPGCSPGTIYRCAQGSTACRTSSDSTSICLRMNGRPSVHVRLRANLQSYAVVAYDIMESNSFFKSRLKIMNITSESNPTVVKSYQSGTGTAWNDYLSNATTTSVNDDVGWFWQTDRDGTCTVRLIGATDTNLGLTSMGGGQIIAGPYPAMTFGGPHGMNDYNAASEGPGGFLYPTWGQPVVTTCTHSPAVFCQSQWWNLQAKISQVQP